MKLASIHQYPVKSCRGFSVDVATFDNLGLEDDRRWMVVDTEGRFLTQRTHPRLATVSVTLDAGRLLLAAPEMDPLDVGALGCECLQEVTVWKDRVQARDGGTRAARWLSEYLDTTCRLVGIGEEYRRPVDPRYAGAGEEVGFADGFPFLLVGEASLDALNHQLAESIPIARFRANFVISGGEPFTEDGWQRIRIGRTEFRVAKPSTRCVVITTDQDSGQRRGTEPLERLAEIYGDQRGRPVFGLNLIACAPAGQVRVGDAIVVLE